VWEESVGNLDHVLSRRHVLSVARIYSRHVILFVCRLLGDTLKHQELQYYWLSGLTSTRLALVEEGVLPIPTRYP
jgi:hypothetical protein